MWINKSSRKRIKNYVKHKTPVHSLPLNMAKAFVTGGAICTLGQVIMNFGRNMGMGKEVCGSITSISLILLSVLLTGWNIYPRVAKWGGAGALVPITGFANSVAAPAIEYKKEGQVMGIGCKIFTIAGPVILYGIFTSWLLGFIYWLQERQVSWDDPENKRSSEPFFHRDTVSDQQRVCCRQKRGRGTAGKFV